MLLTPSLAFSPPPSTSLLPSLSPPENSSQFHSHIHPNHPHHHAHHHARRAKHTPNPRSTLAVLAADERAIAQRKLAIAMYGYSWLKPAGCSKTMLGRREEEVEREEVERQLREVEMQERAALEAEEQERLARFQEEGEATGERDLDDEVPEAEDDNEDEDEDEGDVMEGGEEDGMDADLDDEILDAEEGADSSDAIGEISTVSEGWVYDTNRERDSDEDEIARNQIAFAVANVPRLMQRRGMRGPASDSDVDERAAEELANEMLEDDDEIGEMDFDQEEDDEMVGEDRDLDADVPEADEGGWEHTDSELEDSEMDISILPGQAQELPGARRSSGLQQRIATRRSSARIISGNAAANLGGNVASQRLVHFQTPQLSADTMRPDSAASEVQQGGSARRNWLDAARAGRNLFSISRTPQTSGSGNYFTPSPAPERPETGSEAEEGRAPRRTGRFLGRRTRENRDSLD